MANTKAIGVAFADPEFESVQVGSSAAPITLTSSGVLNGSYATTSATSGDTRLSYQKLTFTGAGAGETSRAFSVVTGARVLTTLLAALQARGGRKGVASLCIGGGEAVAVAVELA